MKHDKCYEKISARKRSVYAPRGNIGVSRLPLSNVPEITEYEDTTDDRSIADITFRKNTLGRTFAMNKLRKKQISRKENSSSCSTDSASNANVSVRLRGGTDFFRTPLKMRRISDGYKCRIFQSTSTRRPIIPIDQSGIIYQNLQKSINGKERNMLPRKITNFEKEQQSIGQSETLKSVGKITILLLYLHFLLSYYLSFSKTQRFEELFEICESETRYE
ncbi:hypothetical protein KPH14_009118 [Odynerus spinipes]|uniref:Uncharacterized protein n=1 Tax=Odynerus spinipes TaxID=1348599 RepID=A0AAD9RNP4_9HYME|nr:hypothetical protein KPH14_009118 [Odynerus spinipes]